MNVNGDLAILDRGAGVALWRQIADRIRSGLESGLADSNGRIPTETTLAERFGVNRHTVRSAIAALVNEGALRTEQGRGTFAVARRRLAYPIGRRTRFAAGLEGQAETISSVFIASAIEAANAELAADLGIAAASTVIRLETLSLADGHPVSRASSWFDQRSTPDVVADFKSTGSITAALERAGIADYFRRSTTVHAEHANDGDRDDLRLAPGAIVLVTYAVNVDDTGRPLHVSRARFAADRVALQLAT